MTTDKEAVKMRNEISKGIERLRKAKGFDSFYAMSKACGFKSVSTLAKVHESGNVTFKTLVKIGKCKEINHTGSATHIAICVLNDFQGKSND
jgi:hypothetical protein